MGIVLKEETWPPLERDMEVRDIPGFDGFYKIDTKARVWSCFTRKYLKYRISQKLGYATVGLTDPSGKHKTYNVSVLMLRTFKGPQPSRRHIARHLNDEPLDNRLENLEWGTRLENYMDAIRNGRMKLKLTRSQIDEIRVSNETQTALAARLGISQQYISNIRHGRSGAVHV